MYPDPVIGIPVHPAMHPNDQSAVGLEIPESFRAGFGVGHVAEPVVAERGDLEGPTLEIEGLAGVGVDSVSALFRLFARERRRDQFLLANESVDVQVFSR